MARSVALTPRWALAVIDVVLVSVIAGLGIWRELSLHWRVLFELPTGVRMAVQVVAAVLLLGRRRWPIICGAAVATLSLLTPTYASVVVPFAAFAYGPSLLANTVLSVAALGTWLVGAQGWLLIDPLSTVVLHAAAAVLGLYARQRVALAESLVQRAERAEREEVLLAERAVLTERVRLAGEMHDTVAHRITLVLLQAGALEVGRGSGTGVREAAERIRDSAGQALDELRQLLDVLGSSAAAVVSEPVAANQLSVSLHALVDRAIQVGMEIDLRADDLQFDVDSAIRHACERVVEEGLTNAARHAPGSPVTVAVEEDYDDADGGWLTITVATAASPEAVPSAVGSGTGLQRMTRRVGLLGGRLTVARPDGRRHVLQVVLPMTAGVTADSGNLVELPR